MQEEELKGAVLVVLANKQDVAGCLSVAEVHRALGLEALRSRTFQIFKTSALKGDGLDEAMEWFHSLPSFPPPSSPHAALLPGSPTPSSSASRPCPAPDDSS